MKNRKKRLMKIGAVIAVIAVAGIAGGVVICKGANRFELTVAGDLISKEEYVNWNTTPRYRSNKIMMPYTERISGKSNTTDNTAMRSSPGIQSNS